MSKAMHITQKLDKTQELESAKPPKAPQNGIYKIYEILDSQKFRETIKWGRTGQFFLVKNPKKLEEDILPVYFSHKKFTSFSRLLNMYGFKKGKSADQGYYFWHRNFVRGKRDLLSLIIRRENEEITIEEEIERWQFTDLYSNLQKKVSKNQTDANKVQNSNQSTSSFYNNPTSIKNGVEKFMMLMDKYLKLSPENISKKDQNRFDRVNELLHELDEDTEEVNDEFRGQEIYGNSDDLKEAYLGKRPQELVSSFDGSLLDFENEELAQGLFLGEHDFGELRARDDDFFA